MNKDNVTDSIMLDIIFNKNKIRTFSSSNIPVKVLSKGQTGEIRIKMDIR